eukprot:s9230_g1.t1
MVCTRDLPENIRKKWHSFQTLVSQLLTQWMTLNRDKDQYEPFLPRSVLWGRSTKPGRSEGNHLSQKIFRNVPLLSLKWQRPATSHARQRWGGTREDFNSVFSFWSMWSVADVPGRVPVSCWSQAFALFVASGGDASPFAACGQYVGMNIYKFRLLSVALLKSVLHIDMPLLQPHQVKNPKAPAQPELEPLKPATEPRGREPTPARAGRGGYLAGKSSEDGKAKTVSIQGIYQDPRRVAPKKPESLLREVKTTRADHVGAGTAED